MESWNFSRLLLLLKRFEGFIMGDVLMLVRSPLPLSGQEQQNDIWQA